MSYRYSLSVDLPDTDVNIGSTLKYVQIVESCSRFCPYLRVAFLSDASIFQSPALYDGQRISVQVASRETGIEEESVEIFPFRILDYTVEEYDAERFLVVLECYLDAPDIFEARRESFDGLSSEVFSAIAGRMGMVADVDITNDRQVWIRPGIRGGAFLNEVAKHSWVQESDFMTWCIRKEGELALKNMNSRLSRDEADWDFRKVFLENVPPSEPKSVYIKSFGVKSLSGTMNNHFGYGLGMNTYSVETGESERVETGEFDKRATNLMVNKEVATYRNYDMTPMSCGNTHANYHRAAYQNLRFQSIFSTEITCTTLHPRAVKLLDTCNLSLPLVQTTGYSSVYAGLYVVVKIATHVDLDTQQMSVNYSMVREGLGSDKVESLY